MNSISRFIRRFDVATYFILAYAFSWILYPLIEVSPLYGLPALFAPALAAVVVTWIVGGRHEVANLLRKLLIWRVGFIWYVVALGLPILISFLVALVARFFGGGSTLAMAPVTPLALIVFVFVVGEELGWRGYAQPRLERTYLPVIAAVILGVIWGLWHLPNFLIPGLPHEGVPLIAFVIYTVGLSILAAWLLKYTLGSVLIATLFHGSVNTFVFLTPGLPTATRWWLTGAFYCLAALVVVLAFTFRLNRARTTVNP